MQIAARRLQPQRRARTLAENRQFEFAECSFHAEQQPVVDLARIIDPILVDDQAVHKGAEFQQRVPVATVAGQARRLDRQHRTSATGTDRRDETFKAGSQLTAPRPAEIIVDNNDVLPAERARPASLNFTPFFG